MLLAHAETGTMVPGADQQRLTAKGWLVLVDGIVRLTDVGAALLADERERAEWDAVPFDQRPRVNVRLRPLGRSPVRGVPGPGSGRNVECWECYRRDREAFEAGTSTKRPDPVVWFTNENTRAAQRDAEDAQRRHGMRHVREVRAAALEAAADV